MVVFLVILAVICMAEMLLLLKDGGKVASTLGTVKFVYRTKGLTVMCRMICGKLRGYAAQIVARLYKSKGERIQVAFRPAGGLGDYIISAKVFEEILEMGDCEITVFCKNTGFGECVYGAYPRTRIKSDSNFDVDRYHYDLALQIDHFVHVKNWNKDRVSQLEPELYKRISIICDNWGSLYIAENKQCWRERLQFERCRMLGLDRWTELRMGGAFDISDKKVEIPLYEQYHAELDRLGLMDRPYITINYGADVMREGLQQLKVWNKEYYPEFISMLKQTYSNLMVVQLGSADAEKIAGVDQYCFGESLEVVKWILKDSLCHIDCEGGLVHLATQLGTTNVVLFGPTPLHMYAYPQNINLHSEKCGNCMGLHEDWAYVCLRGKQPLCMNDIKPKAVADKVAEVLIQSAKL